MTSKLKTALRWAIAFAACLTIGLCIANDDAAGTVITSGIGGGALMVDVSLKKTKALPDGAAAISTDAIDTGVGPDGQIPPCFEIEIQAPILTTTELPDTETMIYDVEDSADGTTFAALEAAVLTQTGAGAAGDAAATVRYRPPSTCRRHIRVTATNSGAGDCTGKNVVMQGFV